MTDASRYDGHELKGLIDPDNTASDIWGDTAYGSKANRKMLEERGFKADIHTKKPRGRPMSARALKANGRRSKIRAFVERPFAHLKGPMRLFVRTIGPERAKTKIGMANLAYNLRRYMFHERKAAWEHSLSPRAEANVPTIRPSHLAPPAPKPQNYLKITSRRG